MKEYTTMWGETKQALLSGLDSNKRGIVETLLDNQRNFMLNEDAASNTTRGDDIAGFRKIMIPLIRRVIPGTIATELVGVQPMTGPVGLVYSMRYKYAEGPIAGTQPVTDRAVSIQKNSEAFGNDHYSFPSNPMYDFYSGGVTTGSPALVDGQPAGSSGFGPGAPGDIAHADTTGEYWLDVSGESRLDGCTSGGHGGQIEGSGGRQMTMEIVSQSVEAGSRKLQAGWTIEAMQDSQNQHGLNLENEMTQGLSAQIVQDIDGEIISDLVALAGSVAAWDGQVPASAGYYRPTYIGDRFANLTPVINYIANEIGRKTRMGSGNFIVVSPMIVSLLQTASKSVFAPSTQGSFKGPNNTELVGTLNGNIKVYSYLWNSVQATNVTGSGVNRTGDDTILVGYKGGNGQMDSGYFYCPYIPLMSSGVVINPLTYQPNISLMTRYGKAIFTNSSESLGNSQDYYGKINVTDLSFA